MRPWLDSLAWLIVAGMLVWQVYASNARYQASIAQRVALCRELQKELPSINCNAIELAH